MAKKTKRKAKKANKASKKKERMITVKINDKEMLVRPGKSILETCREINIEIPHFCYHKRLPIQGACRMCVVEVEGARNLVASCSTPIRDGMDIKTHSPRVIEARKVVLELLLANHDLNCPTCKKNLACRLQEYCADYMVEDIRYTGAERDIPNDLSSVSIQRRDNKCILCGRCIEICNVQQTVNAIGFHARGFNTYIGPSFDYDLKSSACVNCGQCVVNCPTGALTETDSYEEVFTALNSGKHIVCQVAPSIRATLGECFGMPAGSLVTGKMVCALKKIGFDKVFDTDLGADMTIVEEATEFVKRIKSKKNLPMITTCCPAWIKFGEQFFFRELEHMSTCKSPQAMFGTLVKTYYAKKMKIDPKDIILVDIMPCTAKKYEIKRPEFNGDVDYVLTTVELGKLIKMHNLDFDDLGECEFDNPLGESTGAGAIFGRTGGVMEAALRTAHEFITGKKLAKKKLDFKGVRGMDTFKETSINIAGEEVKIAVVHTLGQARKIMEQIQKGTCPYHFIEIMACYGGCIGGGGQPLPIHKEILDARSKALNRQDKKMKIRQSHKNPTVKKIYKEFVGKPGSPKAHELLHTEYKRRPFV